MKSSIDGITARLASSLGRRDEKPNISLAEEIARTENPDSVAALIQIVEMGKKALRHDAIKVLYEIGERKPRLIAKSAAVYIALLADKDNRLQWGAMTALQSIADVAHKRIASSLSQIVAASNKGSVITRDNAVKLFVKLASREEYRQRVWSHLIEILRIGPENQLPMYAELCLPVSHQYGTKFRDVLSLRLKKMQKPSGRRRIEKVLLKILDN